MRTFFLSVFLASLAGALSVAFAGGGAYEKYIKYIVSLLLILLLISPFASLKSIDYELEAQETLSIAANDGAVYEQQIHEELLLYFDALLQNDLGINARDIRIDIGIQDGEAVVGDITVYVDEDDLTEAGAYLFAKFGSGVTASARRRLIRDQRKAADADKIEILSLYRARTGGRHRAVAAARHGRNGEHDRFRTLVG